MVVKRNKSMDTKAIPDVDKSKLEEFANGVDGAISKPRMGRPPKDPATKRDYKAINVTFNQAEYEMLEDAAERSGRSKNNFIRWAIAEMFKRV